MGNPAICTSPMPRKPERVVIGAAPDEEDADAATDDDDDDDDAACELDDATDDEVDAADDWDALLLSDELLELDELIIMSMLPMHAESGTNVVRIVRREREE